MGNKHALAPDVARLVADEAPRSPLVDLFCGMCSIGSAVAPSGRPVWGNDIQGYAAVAAECLIASRDQPVRSPELSRILFSDFSKNAQALRSRFEPELRQEIQTLARNDLDAYQSAYADWRHVGNDVALASEAQRLARHPKTFPYRLCTLTFAWGYFGLAQAIELDSLRYAIDRAKLAGTLTADQAQWALLALLGTASTCGSAPGHFAQYLKGSTVESFARIARQRARHPWDIFLQLADGHRPFGGRRWRKQNRVMCQDALGIWPALDDLDVAHAVIYADPPYSKDHYSRYYHVLETLTRYDYPSASGSGRYRPDRFHTPFSLKREVAGAFQTLFQSIADRGWTLVLSYPSNGLLTKCSDGASLDDLLGASFRRVRLAHQTPIAHSTLGARHGASRVDAVELIWVAS